ncbi:MAG TPA: TasA family protein [Actinomycetota bacterium]
MSDRRRKLLLTVLVVAMTVGVIGMLAGVGVLSAFSSTTSNDGNSFATGTVTIGDNDAGSAMYSVGNRKPNDSVQSCIKLTYTGTLAADVHLYTTSSFGALGQYLDMTVEKGTFSGAPAFPSCTGFTADAGGPIFSGTLASFASAKDSYANGVAAFPASQTQWSQNDTLVYRFSLAVQDNNAAAGLTTGAHSFTWEAQNQ